MGFSLIITYCTASGFVSSPRLRLSNVVRETRKLLMVCDIPFGIAASVTPFAISVAHDQCELQLSLALQLHFDVTESMGLHDSDVMDGSGIDREHA